MMDQPPPEKPKSHFEQIVAKHDEQFSQAVVVLANSDHYQGLVPYDTIENYHELPCSEVDQRKIKDLVKTLATNNYITLWAKHNSRLRRVEKEIYHVHPFKFLATIHNHPTSKKYFKKVLSDTLLRKNFVSGFGNKMERDHGNNNFARFLDAFSADINLPKDHLSQILSRKRWGELLEYIARN